MSQTNYLTLRLLCYSTFYSILYLYICVFVELNVPIAFFPSERVRDLFILVSFFGRS